jgi:23S rRNA pseudouridine1911/1915/1917 synthase
MNEIYVPEIIYEDSAVIVCRKPAGLATQTARVGQKDLVSMMMNHVAGGKTAPYLGLINRLDQPVSGLVLLAKDPGSAAVLSAEQKSHDMVKEYQAAALGQLEVRNGYMSDYIITDSRTNTSSVTDEKTEGAKKAVLEFSIVRTGTVKEAAERLGTGAAVPESLAEHRISYITVRLITGRHHQIRLQMSHAGLPLLGDNKYGSEDSRAVSSCLGIKGLMLCACRLSFTHPSTHKAMEFTIKSNI